MSSFASTPEAPALVADTSEPSTLLPISTVVVYGLPSVALGFMGALISMYLLKYSTDVLLLAPGLVGLLFGLSRIWDAVSDPLAGYFSDRTNSRFGRRRPWLMVASFPLGLSFLALWSPPSWLQGNELALWMGAGIILFYTAQTALSVPHLALGAELTNDYHGRSRVFGARQLLEFVGIFLAAGALAWLEPAADPRSVATTVAIAGAIAAASLTLITAIQVRERPENLGRGASKPYAAFRDVLRNPHARLLVAVLFLEQLGFSCLITVVPYSIQYILGESDLSGLMMGAAIAAALVFYPFWFPLARRYGKRDPWIAATLLKAVAFAVMFWMQPGAWAPVLIAVVFVGAAQGAGGILGPSIQSDTIDYDEFMTGERKEGAYFAVWNLASKSASGLAVITVGFVLQVAGFQPNIEQNETTLLAIRGLAAGLPLLFTLAAAFLLWRFRLNAREHASIRAELDARAGRVARDPGV